MPLTSLFNTKFQPTKLTTRKKLEFHPKKEQSCKKVIGDSFIIHLGDQRAEFIKGSWKAIPSASEGIYKDFTDIQQKSIKLKEENNLLKLKVDILIDMLTQATSKLNERKKKIKELEQLLKT